MSGQRGVLLAGATGLVGGQVLSRLLAGREGPPVLALSRRALPVVSPRLTVVESDLAAGDDEALAARLSNAGAGIGAFVCCLGTTLKAAGSREAFLAVDRELILRLAGIALKLGARQAIVVSSVGASAQSGNFYLRVKGETERSLADMGFERLDLLRPGLLLGDRSESRPGEAVARALAPVGNALMLGPLRRYRGIAAADVAAAAVALLGHAAPGRHVHEYAQIRALAVS